MTPSPRPSASPGQPSSIRSWLGRERQQLALLLLAALLLRLAFLSSQRPDDFLRGGDGPWYVHQGWLIAQDSLPAPLTTVGPLYPVGLALLWAAFPTAPEPVGVEAIPSAYLTLVRLIQTAMSLLVVWLGYSLARGLTGNHAAGMITAIGLGLGPAFIIEPIYILTEPTFIALMTLGVWLYTRAAASLSRAGFAMTGFVLALSALARPVALLFPLVLIPRMGADRRVRSARMGVPLLLGAFVLTVLPWAVYLQRTTGSVLPEGFASNLWIGAVGEGQWEGNLTLDEWRQGFGGDRGSYVREALRVIASDPIGWVTLRAGNLAAAVLIPHGTSDLTGPSIKELFRVWLLRGMPFEGLRAIVTAPYFLLKLVIYGFHYAALGLGALGAWISIKRWREFYAMYAGVLYLVAAYALLTVLPRYLFPAEVFLWVFAAVGGLRLLARVRWPAADIVAPTAPA